MPLPVPLLDDRRTDDLVAELLARIPGHAPEWTNPRVGDPGRSLFHTVALAAFLNRKEVQLLISGCVFDKPKIIAVGIR